MGDVERNKLIVRRFYDEIWNRPDLLAIPELLAPDVRFRGSLGGASTGHAAFADYVQLVTGALDGYHCDIEQMIGEGDDVVARMRFSGVHVGPLLGYRRTRRFISWPAAAFFTLAGTETGQVWITSMWVLADIHDLREQLSGSGDPAGADW